jgi:hypothetical protein
VATGAPALRPLGLGEILDVAIKIYMRHWRTLMACVVLVVLPVQIISVLITLSIAPEFLDVTSDETGVSDAEAGTFLAAQAIIALMQGLVWLLSTAACFKAVADSYLGGRPSARVSLGFAVQRLPRLFWLYIVYSAGVALALIALIVPGIWLAVAWALSVPVLLFERVGAFKALGRSFRLVRGRWWKTAATLVIGVVLASLLGVIVQGILLFGPALLTDGNDVVNAFATVVANTASSVLTTPFTAAVVALIYFDQRVRKEGFDLQLLAEGVGAERGGDAQVPAPLVEPEVSAEDRARAPYWPPPPGWKPPSREAGESARWSPPQAPAWPPDESERGSTGL